MTPPLSTVQSNLRAGIDSELQDGKTYTSEDLAKLANKGLAANSVTDKGGASLTINPADIDKISGKQNVPEVAQAPQTGAQQEQPKQNSTTTPPTGSDDSAETEEKKKKPAEIAASVEQNPVMAFVQMLAGMLTALTDGVSDSIKSSNAMIDESREGEPKAPGTGVQKVGLKMFEAMGTLLTGQTGRYVDQTAKPEAPEAPPRDLEIKSTALDTKPNPEVAAYNDRMSKYDVGQESYGDLKPKATPSKGAAPSQDTGRFT